MLLTKGKFVDDDGDYCVEIERHAINQRGEDVMPGCAVVALVSKENGQFPLDKLVNKSTIKRPSRKSSKK